MINPLIAPSSVLPALSGLYESVGYWPSGYETWVNTQLLLQAGSGLPDGNFRDFRQHRDFNATAGIDALGIPGVTSSEILGLPLAGFPDPQAGLNKRYPSPESYKFGNAFGIGGPLYGQSGIFITEPPFTSGNTHPGMVGYTGSSGVGTFSFKDFLSKFSNAPATRESAEAAGITDFTIFNDYIHHLGYEEESTTTGTGTTVADEPEPVRIPFVSDLIPTTNVWDRYGNPPEDDENSDSDPDYSGDG